MTIEQIEKFLLPSYLNKSKVVVSFKKRPSIVGVFIKTADFGELKSKNFWRIVLGKNFDDYHKSKSVDFTRIFSGSEFSNLAIEKEKE